MPKCRYLDSADERRRDSMDEKSKRIAGRVAGEIGRICGERRITRAKFAEEAGITQPTFSRKCRDPAGLTLGEMARIKWKFPEFTFTL